MWISIAAVYRLMVNPAHTLPVHSHITRGFFGEVLLQAFLVASCKLHCLTWSFAVFVPSEGETAMGSLMEYQVDITGFLLWLSHVSLQHLGHVSLQHSPLN
jgi:hypothetical protein